MTARPLLEPRAEALAEAIRRHKWKKLMHVDRARGHAQTFYRSVDDPRIQLMIEEKRGKTDRRVFTFDGEHEFGDVLALARAIVQHDEDQEWEDAEPNKQESS